MRAIKVGRRRRRADEDVILLQDLAPQHPVLGGAAPRVFGQSVAAVRLAPQPPPKPKPPVR